MTVSTSSESKDGVDGVIGATTVTEEDKKHHLAQNKKFLYFASLAETITKRLHELPRGM